MQIQEPGFLTTIQDRGRFNYQKWGVPVAGAMDEYALQTANLLVGNDRNEGCLEITLLGPKIKFLSSGLVALAGADLGAKVNGVSYRPWRSFRVKSGDMLSFSGVLSGCRVYLAVAGGFKLPGIMGSCSTYLRGKIGGIDGRALCRGDELSINKSTVHAGTRVLPAEYQYNIQNPITVKVVLGPQVDAFTKKGLATFLENKYTVTNESDRMGCRLDGPQIEHKYEPDIVSDGIAIGSVQVPGNGKPIVMMADRQTVGGYAKIATVITSDLWKLAQAKPGDQVRFTDVTLEQAQEDFRKYKNRINSMADILSKIHNNSPAIAGKKRVMLIKIDGLEYVVEIEELK